MRFSLFIFAMILLSSCKKHEDFNDVKIIGHAISGLNVPSSVFHDNSREALEMTVGTSGCDGIEIDLQLSASKSLWLFHNTELNGETNASGCIDSKSDEELNSVHYKSIHKEKLLALKNVPFDRLKGKTLMLDLRHSDYCKSKIHAVQDFLDQLESIPELQDGSMEVMVLLSYAPWADFFTGTGHKVIWCPAVYGEVAIAMENPAFDGVIIRNSEISKEQVAQLKSAGKKVIIFEVRSPKGIKNAMKKRPDYLVTDDVKATIIEKY